MRKGRSDVVDVGVEQGKQVLIGNVAGPNDQQLCWNAAQNMSIPEVAVLGDDDSLLRISDPGYFLVGGAVPRWQVGCVTGIVTGLG